jgi:hypothetical protein
MMITAIIDTTALLDKPLKASVPLIKPSMGKVTMAMMATISTRIHSIRNKNMTAAITPNTRSMSVVRGIGTNSDVSLDIYGFSPGMGGFK